MNLENYRVIFDALTHILAVRSILSQAYEMIGNKETNIKYLQEYVFSQNFCVIIAKNDVKNSEEETAN